MAKTWPALAISADRDPAPWDLIQAALTDFDVSAIAEPAPDTWNVFFHTTDERDRALGALRPAFAHLTIDRMDVPDEDWPARSQASLRAVRVGRIVVAPPWDASHEGDAVTIVIRPSMGFGTGHHATTRLCLDHLQQFDLRGASVLDIGTGSGVLALAASRLGASRVLAIDDDEDAIEAARDNLTLNQGAEVTLGTLDVRRATLRPFDLALANLTGGLLVDAAASLLSLVAPNGRLVLSGFLAGEEAGVLGAFASCAIERRSQEDEWVSVTLRRLAANASGS